jgi:Uma2 family endonuclease
MPTPVHERVVALFCFMLETWARAGNGGTTFASGLKVRVSERRGVMPDVQFYRRGNEPWGDEGVERGRPDLAIEIISPSSIRYDRVVKLGYYATLGVPEYWIVDVQSGTLERLLLEGTRYTIADALSGDAILTPGTFEGLEVRLAEIWVTAHRP